MHEEPAPETKEHGTVKLLPEDVRVSSISVISESAAPLELINLTDDIVLKSDSALKQDEPVRDIPSEDVAAKGIYENETVKYLNSVELVTTAQDEIVPEDARPLLSQNEITLSEDQPVMLGEIIEFIDLQQGELQEIEVSPQSIGENINQQILENTLVQVVKLEVAMLKQDEALPTELTKAINELALVLPEDILAISEEQMTEIMQQPEIIDSLYVVFAELGYTKPLEEFSVQLSQSDKELIKTSLHYIVLLTNDHNWHELKANDTGAVSRSEKQRPMDKFARIVLRLLTGKDLTSAVQPV